ncbi:hypothetical protein [Deinococcus sp.]|uniref:hypothetical protein n=1 Tax=Deinococcus sp. TaxID=47478 RepID=UPI003B5A7E01
MTALIALSSCAPTIARIDNIDKIPSEYLYDQSLSFLISRGYTIKTADKSNFLLVGEFYNTYSRNTYPATVHIRPVGSDPRVDFNFTIGVSGDYKKFMSKAVADYR